MNIIIDFEFTGLDNTFISDNEIIQVKAVNVETGVTICGNFSSVKPISIYGQLSHKCKFYEGEKFSVGEFEKLLNAIGASIADPDPIQFYGFSVEQDKKMLAKYGITLPFVDLYEMLQLSEYESQLATEGRGLECVYLMLTGKYPKLNSHDGLEELNIIHEIYKIATKLELKKLLTVMPHGHCAGMPLSDYIKFYRRAADGYRYNNNDILAASLHHGIECMEQECDDLFEDDDDEY